METFAVDPGELDDYLRTIKDYESDVNGFAVISNQVSTPRYLVVAGYLRF